MEELEKKKLEVKINEVKMKLEEKDLKILRMDNLKLGTEIELIKEGASDEDLYEYGDKILKKYSSEEIKELYGELSFLIKNNYFKYSETQI